MMKKILLGIGVVTLFTACGGATAEAVNVDDVQDACDCSSAFIVVANDILDEIGDKTERQMKDDDELMKTMKPKFQKLDDLEDKCRKELKVKLEEMIECDSDLEEVMKKYEQKF